MRLKNKFVVVAGASSGKGKVIVEQLVKKGANVVAVARRGDIRERKKCLDEGTNLGVASF